LLHAGIVHAQQSVGTIEGAIRDATMRNAKGLRLVLVEAASGATVIESVPEANGSFVLRVVPFAHYTLRLMLDSAELAQRRVAVMSSVPVVVSFDSLRIYRAPEVAVSAAVDRADTRTHTFYTEEQIENLPVPSREKGFEAILLNTPGVVPDEDGRMHVRGEDAQLQYVIDGIPVTANLTRVYSSLFSSTLIKTVDVQTGGLNAEYGRATAAVMAITTKSGFDRPFIASAWGTVGSFGNRDGGAEVGGSIGDRAALYLAGSASTSDRYLDPIAEGDPIHDAGDARHFFGKGNVVITDRIDASVIGLYDHTNFEIPNGFVRTPAQDQRQELTDYMGGLRVNADIGEASHLSLVGYLRHGDMKFTSGGLMEIMSAADTAKALAENEKFFIGAHRVNDVRGGQLEFSTQTDWLGAGNNVKMGAGGESYPLSEFFTFAVTNPALSNPDSSGGDIRYRPYDLTQGGIPFRVDESRTGKSLFAFAQDQLTFDKWTVNVGVRYDMFDLFEQENAISPRLGVAYAWNDDLVLRASYNRVVMQAPFENILVSSSNEARMLTGAEQGSVPTQVRSEKGNNFELGANYRVNDYLTLDLVGYGKLLEDFIVKVELGNTGIIYPVNHNQGLVAGGELRAEQQTWNNLSGVLSVAGGAALGLKPDDGSSPIDAGLILGEEGTNYSHPFAGEDAFPTEHNQLLTASMNLTYQHPATGIFATIGSRFDMGLPFDLTDEAGNGVTPEQARVELRRRGYSDAVIDLLDLSQEAENPNSPDKSVAPHAIFDVAAGIDLETLLGVRARIAVTALNVFDTPYLYKFESSFGGTHFGQPRIITLGVEAGL
jgi:outer membrane receptor protein involved in Fe transport